MVEDLELPFYSSAPGVLGSPPFPFSLQCSVKGCGGDVAWLSSHHMSDPSPCYLRRMMVPMLSWLQWARRCWLEMVLGQNIRRILFRLLVWKVDSSLRSLSVILQHSEPYSRVGSTHLWYILSLVLVLYCDDCHTFFSILKAFLALLRRFLMSLPAPPSCLAVLPR